LVQAELLPIGAITAAHNGKVVRVRGRVASARAPEAGTKQPFSLILKEGEGSIRVTYWSSVDDVIAVKPVEGATFEIEGVIEVYKDKPQLKVESGYKVMQVEPAVAAAPAAEAGPAGTIASITAADKGQTRSVQGTLGAPRALGKGTAFALTDDSGTIDLILWDSIIPADVRESLTEGLKVSAAGEVGEYDGKLQLKANPGQSVRAIP
jgi:DNA/RNA endonuclease YhcR with UshA esterase domain